MTTVQRLAPCLWFDSEAEEAAKYYCDIFKSSRITKVTHYGKAGYEIHRRPEGSVMTVSFELDGQPFTALNGGPLFKFNEAVSFQVLCDNQEEIDLYWEKLTAGGDPKAQQCGWLKDRFGLSWQITPRNMPDLSSPAGQRMMEAFLKMKKIDLAALERAAKG
jgi:predicted 3-demethylubiquinone-9 3-methyltransferase (glyoxalase superfamily)